MGLIQNIKDAFVKSSKEGLYLPVAYDAVRDIGSVTLFFMYLANLLALASLIYLHVKGDPLLASITTAIYAVIQTVLYMMRRIQKAKFDLDDREIDLEADDDQEEKDKTVGSDTSGSGKAD